MQRESVSECRGTLNHGRTFTRRKNIPLRFVLEKEFTGRVGEEKKTLESTQQCLWRKQEGKIPRTTAVIP